MIFRLASLLAVALVCASCAIVPGGRHSHLPRISLEVTDCQQRSNWPCPAPGDLVTVRMTVRNLGNQPITGLPVEIRVPLGSPMILTSSPAGSLPPGRFTQELLVKNATLDIQAQSYAIVPISFVPKAGFVIVTGCIGPQFTECNTLDLTLYETQELDYQKAGRSGAGFADLIDGFSGCTKLGQGDAKRSEQYGNGQTGVVFVADCLAVGLEGVPLGFGGKANPEVFQDFRLVNGWAVNSFETKFNANPAPPGVWFDTLDGAKSNFTCASPPWAHSNDDFTLNTPPTIGSDNPFMKAHLQADAGCYLAAQVKVLIRGPAFTSPYGPATRQCFSVYAGSDSGTAFACALDSDCAPGFRCFGPCGCMRD